MAASKSSYPPDRTWYAGFTPAQVATARNWCGLNGINYEYWLENDTTIRLIAMNGVNTPVFELAIGVTGLLTTVESVLIGILR